MRYASNVGDGRPREPALSVVEGSDGAFGPATSKNKSLGLLQKLYHCSLCKITVMFIAIAFANERTMPAIRSLDKGNVRIRSNLLPRFGQNANERIVPGV